LNSAQILHKDRDSDRCAPTQQVKRPTTMSLDAVDYRAAQEEEIKQINEDVQNSLMTPVRRAALDALEREFSELLKKRPR